MTIPAELAVTKLLTYVFDRDCPLPIAAERRDLVDGLYLAPLPTFIRDDTTNPFVLMVDALWGDCVRNRMHKTTLNVAFPGQKDLNREYNSAEEKGALRTADSYLMTAMLHTPMFSVPFGQFITIPGAERICASQRNLAFGRLSARKPPLLSDGDIKAINALYPTVKAVLASGNSGRLPIAIRYYQQAFRMEIDWSVRFLGMMMAMEALFSHATTEIRHQVSERTAFFLRTSPGDREQLYEEMKKHYDVRSKIAHGSTPKGKSEDLSKSFEDLLVILRATLLTILASTPVRTIFESAGDKAFGAAKRRLIFRGSVVQAAGNDAPQPEAKASEEADPAG